MDKHERSSSTKYPEFNYEPTAHVSFLEVFENIQNTKNIMRLVVNQDEDCSQFMSGCFFDLEGFSMDQKYAAKINRYDDLLS